jgi:hypothetical protein
MTQQERMAILRETGAITEGHFLINSSIAIPGVWCKLARLFERSGQNQGDPGGLGGGVCRYAGGSGAGPCHRRDPACL